MCFIVLHMNSLFPDNLTYDVGFHNPGSLDSSFNLYDDVANATTASGTGEGNYFEVTESGFSNLTYESVNAGGVYSELSAAHMSDTQVGHYLILLLVKSDTTMLHACQFSMVHFIPLFNHMSAY